MGFLIRKRSNHSLTSPKNHRPPTEARLLLRVKMVNAKFCYSYLSFPQMSDFYKTTFNMKIDAKNGKYWKITKK